VKRSLVTLAAAAAAAGLLIGVLATRSDARSPHSPQTITFTLVRVSGFFPPGPPKPGTRYGSLQTVTGDDGSTGTADVLCTYITTQTEFCNLQFTLTTGLLAVQGIARQPNDNEPFTVTGGTGAYAIARGTATVSDVNETTVRLTVKLPA
jgi:hypothetical protein